MSLTAIEWAARQFEPKPRRHATPGDLARALDPETGRTAALDLIDDALVSLIDGRTGVNALAIFLPPQEGKSQRVSRRFPEWLLDHDQTLNIAIVSYELDLAVRWGRDIKQDIALHGCPFGGDCQDVHCARLHIDIRRDSSAAGRWETEAGGGVYCVGIGGPLTGRPVDVLILDDPVKDRAAAESEKIRDTAWDWWESVALTRFGPRARTAMVQTRWHEDDLAGRIEARPSPLRWRTLAIPAIAGDDDPLGRLPGEELASVRHRTAGYFKNMQAGMSPYVFSGVYQQSPTAPEGNFFRRAAFRYWRPMPPWADGRERLDCETRPVTLLDCWRFATVDVAGSTKSTADFTVIAAWAATPEGDLVLLDRVRARADQGEHFGLFEPLRRRWGLDQLFVERGYFSTTLTDDARDAGIPAAPVVADTDKVTRAIPAAGRVHAGRVWFPAKAPWLDEWCDELASFPRGSHDDQVDTLAYAARVITAQWTPAAPPPRQGLNPHERAVTEAASSATGDTGGGLDIMAVPY